MLMKNKEKIFLDITNDKCPITFVKTKIALETVEVFAPLAQRLGMKEWQDELEDISFEVINPEAKKR